MAPNSEPASTQPSAPSLYSAVSPIFILSGRGTASWTTPWWIFRA